MDKTWLRGSRSISGCRDMERNSILTQCRVCQTKPSGSGITMAFGNQQGGFHSQNQCGYTLQLNKLTTTPQAPPERPPTKASRLISGHRDLAPSSSRMITTGNTAMAGARSPHFKRTIHTKSCFTAAASAKRCFPPSGSHTSLSPIATSPRWPRQEVSRPDTPEFLTNWRWQDLFRKAIFHAILAG